MKAVELRGALRMWRRARVVRGSGFHKFQGTPSHICETIINDCFDTQKEYFRVSTGHFCEFWVRDFAFCAAALVELGYKERVDSTLRYALRTFVRHGRLEGTISPDGVPFTFPRYAPDTLALFLHAILLTHNEHLVKEHHAFFQAQVDEFIKQVVDASTALPRTDRSFSSIRDHARRTAACYDAVMIAVVARACETMGLQFPNTFSYVRDALVRTYWNGTYFFQDINKQNIVVGDANVFPFWTGVITDKEMRDNAMAAIQAAGLDEPWPLRYVSSLDIGREKTTFHIADWFAKDYETDSIWMHLGLCYLDVLRHEYPQAAHKHVTRIRQLIGQYKTFLEVYNREGDSFKTSFYVCDEGMLWCANILVMLHPESGAISGVVRIEKNESEKRPGA